MELLILIASFVFGFIVGEYIMAWKLREIILKEARREGIIDDNYNIISDTHDKPNVFKLFVEKAQDTLYLYDYDANTFVCQANTIEDLASLALKYKNIKYAAVVNGDQTLLFIEGVVKKSV